MTDQWTSDFDLITAAGVTCSVQSTPWKGGRRWHVALADGVALPVRLHVAPLDASNERVLCIAMLATEVRMATLWRCAGWRHADRWLSDVLANVPHGPLRLPRRFRHRLARLVVEDAVAPLAEEVAA